MNHCMRTSEFPQIEESVRLGAGEFAAFRVERGDVGEVLSGWSREVKLSQFRLPSRHLSCHGLGRWYTANKDAPRFSDALGHRCAQPDSGKRSRSCRECDALDVRSCNAAGFHHAIHHRK